MYHITGVCGGPAVRVITCSRAVIFNTFQQYFREKTIFDKQPSKRQSKFYFVLLSCCRAGCVVIKLNCNSWVVRYSIFRVQLLYVQSLIFCVCSDAGLVCERLK